MTSEGPVNSRADLYSFNLAKCGCAPPYWIGESGSKESAGCSPSLLCTPEVDICSSHVLN